MNTEMDLDGFRDRLSQLIGGEAPFAWAKRLGLPSATFDRMWNGGTVPRAEHLLQIARGCGVSVDWLLTGTDSTCGAPSAVVADPSPPPAVVLDAKLMGRIVDTIRSLYKEQGQGLPDRTLGEMAAEWYGEIVAAADDPFDRAAALGARAERFRQELQQAARSPLTGKHRA